MHQQELLPHLFRQEFCKITSVLCKTFGFDHIETAEDIAAESFVAALETWPYQGIPPNPTGWLYTVAKNKARNLLGRENLFASKISPVISADHFSEEVLEPDLSDSNIKDSQLAMMFAVCDPTISADAQIGLALRVLCGLSIDEIANALLCSTDVVAKRLYRAKQQLKASGIKLEIPTADEMCKRSDTVLKMLYLLFNEGYYSESADVALREELSAEAIALAILLLDHPSIDQRNIKALLALMYFQASRFRARQAGTNGSMLFDEQDKLLWNRKMIAEGARLLNEASVGNIVSSYHLEAAIAYWHTTANEDGMKWKHILQLFDQLIATAYTPVVALNRIYAFAKVYGNAAAIKESEDLKHDSNPFFFALHGELHIGIDNNKAIALFEHAICLAKNNTDRSLLQKKIDILKHLAS